jgi:hypothetical protein
MPLDLNRLAIRDAVAHDRAIRTLLRSGHGKVASEKARRVRAEAVVVALIGRPSGTPR